jgi:iron complex transport system permease protein
LVGISQGAALAVVILTMVFPQYIDQLREVVAFSGAITVALFIQRLSGHGHTLKFILLGVGVAAFIAAITSTFLTYGNIESAVSALAWLAGSVHSVSWREVSILSIVFTLIFILALSQARKMSVISLGNEAAIGLGISLKQAANIQLFTSVSAAAVATAIVGPLGFVGLLAPHLAKRLTQCGPATHLILTAAVGATLVLLADLVGRSLFAPAQLAAGLVTSLIGAPLFAYLLIRNKKQ